MEFERVLVPIDFSRGSIEAFEATLAHFQHTQVYLLHVIDTHQSDAVFGEDVNIEFQSKIQDAAYQKLDGLAKSHPGYDCKMESLVSSGRPVNIILDTAKQYNIDLIVMGSHGNTSITKTFFGHTTYHVSRKADCSTWVIKGNSTDDKLQHVA